MLRSRAAGGRRSGGRRDMRRGQIGLRGGNVLIVGFLGLRQDRLNVGGRGGGFFGERNELADPLNCAGAKRGEQLGDKYG